MESGAHPQTAALGWPQQHKIRDGLVHAELSPLLQRAGYTYGGTLLNVPRLVQREDAAALRAEQPSFVPGDLLVLGTRPPVIRKKYIRLHLDSCSKRQI